MTNRAPVPRGVPQPQLVVGIAVDATMSYGRGILRGALRFANTRHHWVIREELHAVTPDAAAFRECAGVIMTSDQPSVLRSFLAQTQYVVNCSESGDAGIAPVVCTDGEAVGRMAAEHLMSCPLKNFAYYGPSDANSPRFKGFQSGLAAAKLACLVSPASISRGQSESNERQYAADLAGWLNSLPKPIGIFASNDQGARDVALACRQAKIHVPDQVAIVGANNDDLLCESAWPPLSSVEVDFTRIGYVAARQLDRLLSGEMIGPEERRIRLPPRGMVRRQSTDLLAVDDPDVARAVAFIRENACGPFTVGDLLREVPLVRRTLERRFVEKLGRTPYEEITRVRMDMAQRLLRETEETLPRIAERCGFCTSQALNYVFRKVVGNTPAAYRRLHRAAGQ